MELLRDFLSASLEIEPTDIKEIHLQDNEIIPESLEKKYCRLDLLVTIVDKNNIEKKINIEIQVNNYGDYRERALYYASRIFSSGLTSGSEYAEIKSIMTINIIDFKLFHEYPEYYSRFLVLEKDHSNVNLTDKMRIDFLELPKARKNRCENNRIQKWADFLNANTEEDLDMLEETYKNTPITKAIGIVRKMSADEKLWFEIQKREEMIESEKIARNYERKQGLEEGLKQGKEECIEQIVKAMKEKGYSEEEINELFGNL